jgi:FdhE protein
LPVDTGAIIRHLEERERKEGALPQLLKFYQKLLRIQAKVEQKLASRLEPGLSREAINKRLEQGISLIDFDELALDWPLLRRSFTKVAATFAEFPELFGEPPPGLKEPGADRLLTRKVVKAWFEGKKLPATTLYDETHQNLFMAIIHATLNPFLVSHARTLIGFIDQERWRREYCPVCRGRPDFAYLDKERGSKWLLCSRCDTEWIFQRLQCPFCGTQDQNAMAYFTNDKGLYRLYTCEQCKHYLKTIDLRQAESEVFLPLERLLTFDIDRQALAEGYTPFNQTTGKT